MYKVYCDDLLLYDGIHEDFKIFEATIEQELNKVGAFNFTIYPTHPRYSSLQKLKSIIRVERDGVIVFRGRILNDTEGFFTEKKISCESDLAFLLDSIIRPYNWTGDVSGLFSKFIADHNSQVDEAHQFKVGTVTVTDPNNYLPRSDTQYLSTWESLNQKLIEPLGGYLVERYEDDGVYLDYLSELTELTMQDISFGVNLIDFEREIKGEDVYTGIIPLGAKIKDDQGQETDERVTIASVNGGLDYIVNETAAQQYGRIFKTVTWDDVTVPANLLTKAQQTLSDAIKLSVSLTVTAVDLANIGKSMSAFKLGTSVPVKSKPHNVDDYFLVTKLTLDLLKPENDQLVLGASFKTLTEQNSSNQSNISNQITIEVSNQIGGVSGSIAETEQKLSAQIALSNAGILSDVSELYATKNEVNEVRQTMSTTFEQTSDSFNFQFSNLMQMITNTNGQTNAEFELIKSYIQMQGGSMTFGKAGSEITLKLENDILAFYSNGVAVSYITNSRQYIENAEIVKELKIGNFGFTPMSNGSLSFGKVV